MTALWMPPLPEPLGELHYFSHQGHLFARTTNSAQLRQVQADAARAALERAAKVCDSVDNHSNPMTATDCADAIRALAKEIAP